MGLLALASCGDASLFDPSAVGQVAPALGFANANKFVAWQHNISWYSSAAAAETAIKHAMSDYAVAPDIFTFQECGAPCICGDSGSYAAGSGKCTSVGGPSIERALRAVNQKDKYTFRRNGIRVIGFRDARFAQVGSDMRWGATVSGSTPYHAACSTVSVGEQLSVMLEDLVHAPRMHVLVSTGHWFVGRDCACRQVRQLETSWKTAPELRRANGSDARDYVDIHLFSGDWNAEPATALPQAYREGGSCDGVKLGGETHKDTAGSAFTFCQGSGGVSTPSSCYNKQKVDYLWAKNYNKSGITWKGSPDLTANYFNDHRAVRTLFVYAPAPPAADGGGVPKADARLRDGGDTADGSPSDGPVSEAPVDDGAARDGSQRDGAERDGSTSAAGPAGGCGGCSLADRSDLLPGLSSLVLLLAGLRAARRRRRSPSRDRADSSHASAGAACPPTSAVHAQPPVTGVSVAAPGG